MTDIIKLKILFFQIFLAFSGETKSFLDNIKNV